MKRLWAAAALAPLSFAASLSAATAVKADTTVSTTTTTPLQTSAAGNVTVKFRRRPSRSMEWRAQAFR